MSALTLAPASAQMVVDIRSYGARCDGSDDAGAVQAAINAIPTSGGTVIVSCQAGIGSAGLILSGKSDVTIGGTSGGGFRALSSVNRAAQGFSPVMFLIQTCTNCVIRDLVIDGRNAGVAPLGFDRCTNSVALDNTISNVSLPANAAIVAAGNRGNLYRGNIITNTSSTSNDGTRGMWIGNTGDSQTEWSPTIIANIVNNIGATGIVGHAVGGEILGNTVTNAKGAGIKVVPPRGKGGTTVILGNTVRGNAFSGVQVSGADSPVLILGNVMDGNAIAGIYSSDGAFTNAVISGNKMTNNREAGIFLYNAEGVKIEGNDISGSNHGVLFEAQPGQNIHDVLIIGNTIHDQREDGITFWGRGGQVNSIAINQNSISNSGKYGFFVEQNSGSMNGISVSGNCFANNRNGTIFDTRGTLAAVVSSAGCAVASLSVNLPPAGTPLSTGVTNAAAAGIAVMRVNAGGGKSTDRAGRI